jgi:hypothetical protein
MNDTSDSHNPKRQYKEREVFILLILPKKERRVTRY